MIVHPSWRCMQHCLIKEFVLPSNCLLARFNFLCYLIRQINYFLWTILTLLVNKETWDTLLKVYRMKPLLRGKVLHGQWTQLSLRWRNAVRAKGRCLLNKGPFLTIRNLKLVEAKGCLLMCLRVIHREPPDLGWAIHTCGDHIRRITLP